MAELPKMVWDPRTGKFVPLETDGQRVAEEMRRIMLALVQVKVEREEAWTAHTEALRTIKDLVAEGQTYGLSVTDLTTAAGLSRQSYYAHLAKIEAEAEEAG